MDIDRYRVNFGCPSISDQSGGKQGGQEYKRVVLK